MATQLAPKPSNVAPIGPSGQQRGVAESFWEPFSRLRSELDRVFDDFPMRAFGPGLSRRLHSLAGPALEFKERDGEFELVAEVPGMKAEEIDIKVADGVLRLSGERREEKEGKEGGFMFSERSYGRFDRAIQLPGGIDEAKISATASDGLLKVRLPKSDDARQREKKIPVKAS